jgi:hypothetical protein
MEFAAIFDGLAEAAPQPDLPVLPEGLAEVLPAATEVLPPESPMSDAAATPLPDGLLREAVTFQLPDGPISALAALPVPADPLRVATAQGKAVVTGLTSNSIVELRLAGESHPMANRSQPVLPGQSNATPVPESVAPRDTLPSLPMPERPAIAPAAPPSPPRPGIAEPVTVAPEAHPVDAVPPGPESVALPLAQEARRGSETVTLHRAADAPPPAERQIAAAVIAAPNGRTDLVLDPKELGRVRVSLEGDESALVLTIQAERSETADLLRRNADILVQEFRDAGYENLTFSFSEHPRDADRTMEDDPTPAGRSAEVEFVADFSPPRPGAGTLDLRL